MYSKGYLSGYLILTQECRLSDPMKRLLFSLGLATPVWKDQSTRVPMENYHPVKLSHSLHKLQGSRSTSAQRRKKRICHPLVFLGLGLWIQLRRKLQALSSCS